MEHLPSTNTSTRTGATSSTEATPSQENTKKRSPLNEKSNGMETGNVSSVPVTEIVDIEVQKENILPRKHGLSASSLAQTFSTPRKTRIVELKEGHERFEEQLKKLE